MVARLNLFVDEPSSPNSDQSQTTDDDSEIDSVGSTGDVLRSWVIESLPGMETPLSDDDPVSYFMNFLSTLQSIPSVSHFRSLNEADEKAVKELQETESKLSNEERNCGQSPEANKYHALRHLVVQILLQIFLHPGEFSEAASEVSVCCDKAWISSSLDLLESNGCPCGEGEGDGEKEEEPEVMDVLVDTLLSLLPHSSAPLRSSIEQVFKCFCQDVTNDGLLRMLRVIKKDLKPARYQEDQDSEDLDDDDEDCLAIEEDEEMGETENPQVMTVYLNLAQALVNPSTAESSQQLLQRIWGIIQKKIFKAKELFNDESMELSALASLLEKNLKLAAKPFKSKKKSGVDHSKKKQSAAWNRHKMIASLAQNSKETMKCFFST
ncbi:hypothetical protein Bca4012_059206 [Brassica carinata]